MAMLRYEDDAPTQYVGRAVNDTALQADRFVPFQVTADILRSQSLSTLIEGEIIPRLMVAHAGDVSCAIAAAGTGDIEPGDVAMFAPLAMQVEADALLAHIENILARGVSVESVMVDLLAPAARLLGEMWEDDRCDFVDVTMGLWRLQEIVHEIAARRPPQRARIAGPPRALFATMPGDQHHFGTVVVEELFRRDGWLTERTSEAEPHDLTRRVADDWFDLVGLTVSCDCHIAPLPSLIAALRNVARNAHLCVMVGGRIFSASPELALEVGADGTARDARAALDVATSLVRDRARESAACN